LRRRRGDDAQARLVARERLGTREGVVAGAVVDENALPVALRLARDAPQARVQRRRRVEGR
jgi:hypothetical protein